ncbi:MAG: isoaspartyl peptidase/L-asparaginase [Deltaproteobacteria bacterium]|nr:isoaspartyl peptidase/L-asparaginase [Deltaproteobacteria bacterium]
MPKRVIKPALIAHGGAGGRTPIAERLKRRQGLVAAVERGSAILREGGNAIDAVTTTIAVLEDNSLFNAGYGSVLTLDGRVEMDAAIMVAERHARKPNPNEATRKKAKAVVRAGGVVLVSRLRNPILLARLVMEQTPHVLIGGMAAERLARQAGIRMCRPEQLITERARNRWLAVLQARPNKASEYHGTVGAAALDQAGNLAAATSTGGISGKMPGRIGDSAIIGAGLYADATGAASATGTGEAIMKGCLCREAIALLSRIGAWRAAVRAIVDLYAATGGEAGLVMVDSSGGFGYAHNAEAMEIALFAPLGEVRHLVLEPVAKGPSHH